MEHRKPGIGLLGGTYDPVHNGHISIAESFIGSDFLKELWILLTPDPPHKQHRPAAGFDERYRMLEAAFRNMPGVTVSDIEYRLPKPSYTVQTLSYLTEKYPYEQFYLCMGGDSLAGFTTWYKWREILRYCKLLVAERPNGHEEVDTIIEHKADFVPHEPVEISSTEIRERIAEGKSVSEYIPEEVEQIIKENKLYTGIQGS